MQAVGLEPSQTWLSMATHYRWWSLKACASIGSGRHPCPCVAFLTKGATLPRSLAVTGGAAATYLAPGGSWLVENRMMAPETIGRGAESPAGYGYGAWRAWCQAFQDRASPLKSHRYPVTTWRMGRGGCCFSYRATHRGNCGIARGDRTPLAEQG